MVKLSYRSEYKLSGRPPFILEWRQHDLGAELFQTGKGFAPDGFSIGVYSTDELTETSLSLATTPAEIKYRDGVYIHLQPVKYAKLQGSDTRLGICLVNGQDHARPDWLFGISLFSYSDFRVTLHEQGERDAYRPLGGYACLSIVRFLSFGAQINKPEFVTAREVQP